MEQQHEKPVLSWIRCRATTWRRCAELAKLITWNITCLSPCSKASIWSTPPEQAPGALRSHADALLAADPEAVAIRQRHAVHYLSLAIKTTRSLTNAQRLSGLDAFEQERSNIRAALGWTLAGRDVELGLQLVAALWRYWDVRGRWREGSYWLDKALSVGDRVAPKLLAEVSSAAGHLAIRRGTWPLPWNATSRR